MFKYGFVIENHYVEAIISKFKCDGTKDFHTLEKRGAREKRADNVWL